MTDVELPTEPASAGTDEAVDAVDFWRAAGPGRWFSKDTAFDQLFRQRFLDTYRAIASRVQDAWLATPVGALALVLLTDQFPRNAFRGTAQMYATDALARHFALRAMDAGHMRAVDAPMQLFFCLPFAHAEDLAGQDLSVRLHEKLGQPWLSHALGHRDIIRRFGRFPHRNALLGRATTPLEQAFLDKGGFCG